MVGVARLGAGAALRTERVVRGADGWLAARIAELAGGPIDVVAVSLGPGAFTGLRVGIATALGLAVARGVPVVGLSSLAVRATLAPGHARVLVALDAKKSRVYRALYDTRCAILTLLGSEVDGPPVFEEPAEVAVGEGAVVYASALGPIPLAADAADLPLDRCAALVAAGVRLDPAALGPRYLRDADARKPGAPEHP